MFTLTPAAAEHIARAAAGQPGDAAGATRPMLRVAAKIDENDGEPVFGMGFDEEREDDLVIECDGFAVLIAPPSQTLLENATLDFAEVHPGEFQFVFRGGCATPPEARNCGGCGGGCA